MRHVPYVWMIILKGRNLEYYLVIMVSYYEYCAYKVYKILMYSEDSLVESLVIGKRIYT